MAEAALKIEQPYVRVRGMTRPDLQDKAPLLITRLRERYPHLQERQTHGWLQTCCGANEFYFVRSDRAYLLAHRSQEFLDPRPIVREIFAIGELRTDKVKPGSDAEKFQSEQNAIAVNEVAELYAGLLRWCQSIGAGEVIIDKMSDVPLGEKGTSDPGTLREIFARNNIKLYRGEEIFAALDPHAKIRKLGA